LREIESAVTAGETRLEELRRELLTSLGQLNDLRQKIHREQIESEKGTFRQRHLLDELAQRSRELGEAAGELESTGGRAARLEEEVGGRETELAAARGELDGILEREAAAADAVRGLEHERERTAERQRFLTELAERAADEGRSLAARLAEIGLGDAPRLGARVRALRGWERSLDLWLGGLVDAVLVE